MSSLRDSIQVFLVNFQKFVRSPFFQNTFGRLLLHLEPCQIIYDRTFLWKYRSSSPGVLFEKVFLEISQNSQENTCASAFFLKKLLLKKRLSHKCFPVNFAKFLRAPFLKDHHWWLLLEIVSRKLFSQKNYHIFLRGL